MKLFIICCLIAITPLSIHALSPEADVQFSSLGATQSSSQLVSPNFQVLTSSACTQNLTLSNYSLIMTLNNPWVSKFEMRVSLKEGNSNPKEIYDFSVNNGVLAINNLKPNLNYELALNHVPTQTYEQIKGYVNFNCAQLKTSNFAKTSKLANTINNIARELPNRDYKKVATFSELPDNVINIIDVMLQDFDKDYSADSFLTHSLTILDTDENAGLTTYNLSNLWGEAIVSIRDFHVSATMIVFSEEIAIGHNYYNDNEHGQVMVATELYLPTGDRYIEYYNLTRFVSFANPEFVFIDLNILESYIFGVQEIYAPFGSGVLIKPPEYTPIIFRHDGLPVIDQFSVPTTYNYDSPDSTFSSLSVQSTIGVDAEIPNNDLTNFGSTFSPASFTSIPQVGVGGGSAGDNNESSSNWFSDLASFFAPNNDGEVDFSTGSSGAPAAPKPSTLYLEKLSDTSVKINISRTNPQTDDENYIKWSGGHNLPVHLRINGERVKTYYPPSGDRQTDAMWILDGFQFGNNGWQGGYKFFRSGYIIIDDLIPGLTYSFDVYRGASNGPSDGRDGAGSSTLSNTITTYIPEPVFTGYGDQDLIVGAAYRYDGHNVRYEGNEVVCFLGDENNGLDYPGLIDATAFNSSSSLEEFKIERALSRLFTSFYKNSKPKCKDKSAELPTSLLPESNIPQTSDVLVVGATYRIHGLNVAYNGSFLCKTNDNDPSLGQAVTAKTSKKLAELMDIFYNDHGKPPCGSINTSPAENTASAPELSADLISGQLYRYDGFNVIYNNGSVCKFHDNSPTYPKDKSGKTLQLIDLDNKLNLNTSEKKQQESLSQKIENYFPDFWLKLLTGKADC